MWPRGCGRKLFFHRCAYARVVFDSLSCRVLFSLSWNILWLLSRPRLTRLEGLLGRKNTSFKSRMTHSCPSPLRLSRIRTFPRPGDIPSEVESLILVGLCSALSWDLDRCRYERRRAIYQPRDPPGSFCCKNLWLLTFSYRSAVFR